MSDHTTPDDAEDAAPAPLPRDAGLTLLELLVVMTIVVLLTVSIGTVAINYLGGAKSDAARLRIEQISSSLDLYRLDMGRYPTEAEGLDALVERPAQGEGWNGPYIQKRAALEDPWGAPFAYRFPGRHGAYDLYSLGSDGAEGGEDEAQDIVSW